MALSDCQIIQLPKINDARGSLTFIEANRHVPFDFRRAFYLYNVPQDSERGSHAHKKLHQFIMAVSGGFNVILDDGYEQERYHLHRPDYGLYVAPMTWTTLDQFTLDGVCMVFTSDYYNENDYIRNYYNFKKKVRRNP